MADILRTWACLNPQCGASFDAWEANPACVSCGCVRVSWVPGGGNVSRSASGIDAEFRALTDAFKMSDLAHSHGARGQAAKPIAVQSPSSLGGAPVTFAPGFSAPVSDKAQCLPTGMTVKTSATPGQALQPNRLAGAMRGNTRVEARHSGRA